MKRALIVGCGYAGERLGARLIELGYEVVGIARSHDRATELERVGIETLVGDLRQPETLRRADNLGPQAVFYLVPPSSSDDPLASTLAATARAPLEAFVYASSTVIYGGRGDGWVDETDMPRPEGTAAEARHAAERTVVGAGWEYQTRTRICRIAGIYGPGRTLGGRLEDGDYYLVRGHDTWVNRIHVDDLVSGLIAAWQSGSDGRVYNLVDDEPHRSSEFALLAAELHGAPAPEWIEESEALERLGEERARRKLGSKRVRNQRLKDELGVKLEYPSFRTGLPAAVAEERSRQR